MRSSPGSIHRPLSDADILINPAAIAPWIDQVRLDWVASSGDVKTRAALAAMGLRLQALHHQVFGERHP